MKRITAAERRTQITGIAAVEFAAYGLHGTSVDIIARKAGISAAYVYRLFGTKVSLFTAAVTDSINVMTDEMIEAAQGLTGPESLIAMGNHYRMTVRQDSVRLLKLQAFAASLDQDVRETIREAYGREWQRIAEHSGVDDVQMKIFMCLGQLLNGLTAISMIDVNERWEPGSATAPITKEMFKNIGLMADRMSEG